MPSTLSSSLSLGGDFSHINYPLWALEFPAVSVSWVVVRIKRYHGRYDDCKALSAGLARDDCTINVSHFIHFPGFAVLLTGCL